MNINEEWFNSTSREEEGQILNKYITQIYYERTQPNFEIIDISSNKIRTNELDSSTNNTNYIIVDTEATIANLTVTDNISANDASFNNVDTRDICGNDASFNKINVKDLVVDGSLNVNNYIYNNIEVQNKTIFSTSIDISNAGTGPALKVRQAGTGETDSVALFNAGAEGDALLIEYNGKSIFYKDVDINGTLDVSGVTNAFVPRGIIVMWSGSNDNIPSGWVLCNGTNGTPDLMNRFIIGSGSTYTTTDTGGDSSVTLTTSNLPAHSHSGTTSDNGSHSHSGTTSNNGSHSHGILMRKSGAGGDSTLNNPISAKEDLGSSDASTKEGGSHTHTFSTNSGGSHTHTFNTNNTGSGTAFNILPPYFSLAYIMKT